MGRRKLQDPYQQREADKYKNPIVSREYILETLNKLKKPKTFLDLLTLFRLKDDGAEALRRRLKAMLRDGQLDKLKGGHYWPSANRFTIQGKLFADRKKVYWVIPEDGSARILLSITNEEPLVSGDTLEVSVPTVAIDNVREGKLVRVLEKQKHYVTGRLICEDNIFYVLPFGKDNNQDILIPANQLNKAKVDNVVVVEMTQYASRTSLPIGCVVKDLGSENTKGLEITACIHAHNLPFEWPQKVKKQISQFKKTLPKSLYKQRLDLRTLPFVTIDGEDAKDFDDAVYAERKPGGGFKLYVAIADVSYYVKEHSPLDKEAEDRGNSVYFPSQVIPMLPEILSNELCSLKPNVDRLCMIAQMDIKPDGTLEDYSFHEGIIHSHARLTYTKVARALAEPESSFAKHDQLLMPLLQNLQAVYAILAKARSKRGAIEFDSTETRILFTKKGKISSIEPLERNIAHRIIEECMLCANVATANFLKKHKLLGMYRNHDGPTPEKMQDLRLFLKAMHLPVPSHKTLEPKDYGKITKKIEGKSSAHLVQMVLLRSLSQATYSTTNRGHFGLAYPAYTHFTSPIRRYPDLYVHRQIKKVLHNRWDPTALNTVEVNRVETLAEHASATERRADDATRDVEQWLKCQYMKKHLGDIFEGVISAVMGFGFFVELKEIYIEGLVHVTNLHGDYYQFDQVHHRLIGERTKVEFALGETISVIVAKVCPDTRTIDLIPAKQPKLLEKDRVKKVKKFSKKKNHIKKNKGRSKK